MTGIVVTPSPKLCLYSFHKILGDGQMHNVLIHRLMDRVFNYAHQSNWIEHGVSEARQAGSQMWQLEMQPVALLLFKTN